VADYLIPPVQIVLGEGSGMPGFSSPSGSHTAVIPSLLSGTLHMRDQWDDYRLGSIT